MRWANGVVYDGQFVDGKQTGQGILRWANGNVYQGNWLNGNRHGSGILTWPNGNRYDGEWGPNDRPNGYGTYLYSSSVYSGTWVDGCFNDYDGKTAWIGKGKWECGF